MTLRFWDVATRRETRKIDKVACECLAFAADGKTFTTSHETIIQIWGAGSGKRLHQFQAQPHIDISNRGLATDRSDIKSLTYPSGGSMFVTAGSNATVCRWRLDKLPADVPDDKLRRIPVEVNPPTGVEPAPPAGVDR
jgi:WD40 repeat protein